MFLYQAISTPAATDWPPAKQQAWQQLQHSARQMCLAKTTLVDLFHQQPRRAEQFSVQAADLSIDFSKNWLTETVLQQLQQLLEHSDFAHRRDDLFSGAAVNCTENRPALHTLLRASTLPAATASNVRSQLVQQTLQQLEALVTQVQLGQQLGAGGQPIQNFVHIGIGGSDLGPRLLLQALSAYQHADIQIRFVANIDPADFYTQVQGLDAQRTAFILCSKSFSTLETLHNGKLAVQWLRQQGIENITPHLLGITANVDAAQTFGIAPQHIFPMWDWVGGRYSITSAVALPALLSIGMHNFKAFLQGAEAMDQHFQQTDLTVNAPAILALLSVWYNNFLGAQTQAIIPYCQLLHMLPAYLQQLVMESNGKSVDQSGQPINYTTSGIIWGNVGTNSQHSFHQLLHQGTQLCPAEIILPLHNAYGTNEDQRWVMVNALAQTHALMQGSNDPSLPAHRHMPGNRPSTLITLPELTPQTLGNLIALYEHKTFVESCLWNINPFDQWGVELGKQLGVSMAKRLADSRLATPTFDPSTERQLQTLQQVL